MIAATLIDPIGKEKDTSFWSLTNDGEFSIKSAYITQLNVIFIREGFGRRYRESRVQGRLVCYCGRFYMSLCQHHVGFFTEG